MTEFLTVVVLHLFAVISPGPDFALISRQSIRYGRKIAIWSAAGIGMGILFHSLLAISGIIIVISANELYFSLVKFICSGYLMYLGISSIISSSSFQEIDESGLGKTGGFVTGLITNITNIKAFLFFTTLFGVVLDTKATFNLAIYGLYMAAATFVWFSFVAYTFTSDIFRAKFGNMYFYIEKALGLILILIALRVALSELSI